VHLCPRAAPFPYTHRGADARKCMKRRARPRRANYPVAGELHSIRPSLEDEKKHVKKRVLFRSSSTVLSRVLNLERKNPKNVQRAKLDESITPSRRKRPHFSPSSPGTTTAPSFGSPIITLRAQEVGVQVGVLLLSIIATVMASCEPIAIRLSAGCVAHYTQGSA
jgi:hypothetical protein